MPKLSEMDRNEAALRLYDAYMAAHRRYVDDPNSVEGQHPSKDYNRWKAVAGDENAGLGPKTIQKQGTSVSASDDPPDGPPAFSALKVARKAGEQLQAASDGQFYQGADGQPRFDFADGRRVTGDAALVERAKLSNPSRVRGMSAVIKGLDRLR